MNTMRAAHTPGPWHLQVTHFGFHIEEVQWQAHRDHSSNPEDDAKIKQTEQAKRQVADACLIASAPDLLEELQRLMRVLGPLEDTGRLDGYGFATFNSTRAAIAKATGLEGST